MDVQYYNRINNGLRNRNLLRLLMIFLLTCMACGFNNAAPALQSCPDNVGKVERSQYRSAIAQTTMYYSVYTPPCYDQLQTLYPAAYLMHGSNEDDGQWLRLGLPEILDAGIAVGTLPPMIVVMPYGEWIANENQFEAVSWENVFLTELMPLVESTYRVNPRREARVIGGISRGGFWALEIAFRHPDLFNAVGGHSAFLDPNHAPDDFNPIDLATNAPDLESLAIWLDRGKDDYAAPGLDLIDDSLAQRGLSYQYTIYPEGQHYVTYWQTHVAEYMQFYGDSLVGQIEVAPAVLTPTAFAFATNTPAIIAQESSTPIPEAQPGSYWFIPAVAFSSLQTTLPDTQLWTVRVGQPDTKLIVSDSTAIDLMRYGITLTPEIRIVPDDALYNTLYSDPSLYTLLPFDKITPRFRILHVGENLPFDLPAADYPFAFPSDQPNFDSARLTRLLMSGVTALTRNTLTALDKNGVAWAGEAIKPYTDRADFFHTSNEVSFAPDCPIWNENVIGSFCSKLEHFDLLTNIGVDIAELTGNHNLDYGTQAYIDTLQWYQDHGVQTIGGGVQVQDARKPLILEHNGNAIAMLACNDVGPYYALAEETTPGAAACDRVWLREALPALAAQSDLLILTVQSLEMEDYRPTAQQQVDFRNFADLGADVVIGTQAHKPQTFEFYNSARGEAAFIHYGLGNIFFDQPFWGNMRFFMDNLLIYDRRLLTVDLFTGIIDDLARPRPMNADEQLNFLAFMFNTQAGN
jgi:enterochelin esterase-like enzyme